MHVEPTRKRGAPERTCVGCRARDEADGGLRMVRMVVEEGEVAFDLAGGSFGRGAHVHATERCLAAAPRGLARAFHRPVTISPAELGQRLVAACDRRFSGLLLAARRTRTLAIGLRAAKDAVAHGAPLVIVAADAGSNVCSEVWGPGLLGGLMGPAGAAGELEEDVRKTTPRALTQAVVFKSKMELGALLGEESVAICAVCHDGIAAELKNLRVVADAGARAMGEGAGCSRRPEAR